MYDNVLGMKVGNTTSLTWEYSTAQDAMTLYLRVYCQLDWPS